MSKYFIFLSFFIGITLQAQSIKFNPKLGIGIYDFNIKSNQNIEAKSMFTIGADVRIGSGAFFLNTGAHYSSDAFDQDPNTFKENGSLNFLRIPANVGLYLTGRDGILVIFLKGGLTNNFYLSGSGLASGVGSDLVKKYNLAANFGLGFDIFKFVHVGIEYDKGLTNYFDLDPIVGKKGAALINLGLVF
ncbi:MAG: hypothetical protein R2774_02045 [Saprospiraceae bacterium]